MKGLVSWIIFPGLYFFYLVYDMECVNLPPLHLQKLVTSIKITNENCSLKFMEPTCRGVETTASIVVHWVSLSVCLRWLGWTQEHKDHREDATVYPGSSYRGSTSSSRWSLYSRAPKIEGLQQSVGERFGRGLIGADPRYHVAGEVFLLIGEEEDDGRGEELLVQSSSCLVRTRMIYLESSSLSLRSDLPLYIEVGEGSRWRTRGGGE
jgi:hypothetical protein